MDAGTRYPSERAPKRYRDRIKDRRSGDQDQPLVSQFDVTIAMGGAQTTRYRRQAALTIATHEGGPVSTRERLRGDRRSANSAHGRPSQVVLTEAAGHAYSR